MSKVSVQSTAFPTGEIKKHDFGLSVNDMKRPISDLGFNLRVKNIQRELRKLTLNK